MDGVEQDNVGVESLTTRQKFVVRAVAHDKFEEEIYQYMRPYADRKHLPDRRQSFSNIPCSWDAKQNVFVEDNSYHEYWRLFNEGEPMFIVYRNGDGVNYGDGKIYADWLHKLKISGPFEASPNSTCMDDYYRIEPGRTLEEFRVAIKKEVAEVKKDCLKIYIKNILDQVIGNSYQ
ncbi:MAG: hypothetical protein ACYSYU_11305 [Planctomycetota bacterium]|jgi:hypothetical protein